MDTELKSLDLPCGVEEFCKIQARSVVHLFARRFQCRLNSRPKIDTYCYFALLPVEHVPGWDCVCDEVIQL